MNFGKAFMQMKDGLAVKLPEWKSHLFWDDEKKSIFIRSEDGEVTKLEEAGDTQPFFRHVSREDWETMEYKEPKGDSEDSKDWWDTVGFDPEDPPVLRRGDRSTEVKGLQRALNDAGYTLGSDGVYGPLTERKVKKLQQTAGLVVDGIFGPKSARALKRKSVDRLLGERDIEWAARELGVEVAAVKAVSEVESRGNGFFASGLPAILFERHWMFRLCRDAGMDVDKYIGKFPNIINSSPGGYVGGTKEHERLAKATEIHPGNAAQSASWGAYQIMGFHWKTLGYSSIKEFVELMGQDEGQHLKAFVRFIENDSRLHSALKAKDWTTFARIYNGPGYANHNPPYDKRMLSAYRRYA